MSLSLDQLEFLRTPRARELLAEDLPGDLLHAADALRKRCTPEQTNAVLTLRTLRERSEAKFPPEIAADLLATDTLLQQASSMRLASYKARELLRRSGASHVHDLCCGLGGDSIALALAGAEVSGYDVSLGAVLCAAHNAAAAGVGERCTFEARDVTDLHLAEDAVVHIDPDRRPGGRRVTDMNEYAPGGYFLPELSGRARAGCMKLSPAMDFEALLSWSAVEAEWVAAGGVCRQLLIWWPSERPSPPAGPARKATVVWGEMTEPRSASIPGGAAPRAPVRPEGEYLIEPGPSVIAARAVDDLAAELGLWRRGPNLHWLFGEGPVDSPLCRCFRVLETVAGREKDIKRALRALGGGAVDVKPRGVRLDTDAMQKKLRGKGSRRLAVLWTQFDRRQVAYIAEAVC